MMVTRELDQIRRLFPVSWRMQQPYRLPTGDPGQAYYIDWNPRRGPRGEGWTEARFDESGVLVGSQGYSPVTICQFALFQYGKLREGDGAAFDPFMAQASYLARKQDADGSYRYDFPWPAYDVTAGWLSGMAQGEAASVLFRAHVLTERQEFLDLALRALEPLKKDVQQGGASYIREDTVFFEEVASTHPCHILDGHLYAAFAVWEACRFWNASDRLRGLHDAAVLTLQRVISSFDLNGWSCDDLAIGMDGRRRLSRLGYHQLHVAQLKVYAAMTDQPIFSDFAQRWEEALTIWPARVRLWRQGLRTLLRAVGRRVGVGPAVSGRPSACLELP
jgi:hypothetical protein